MVKENDKYFTIEEFFYKTPTAQGKNATFEILYMKKSTSMT